MRWLPKKIPTILVEPGQPDKQVDDLGPQTHRLQPLQNALVVLDDGKDYIIHGFTISGSDYSQVKVRKA